MCIKSAIDRAKTYSELLTIIKNAEENVTFLGFRYVKAQKYKEIASLDAFAQQHLKIYHTAKDDWGEEKLIEEKKAASTLGAKIDELYKKNDKRLSKSNCITRMLCKIRMAWQRFELNMSLNIREQWSPSYSGVKIF